MVSWVLPGNQIKENLFSKKAVRVISTRWWVIPTRNSFFHFWGRRLKYSWTKLDNESHIQESSTCFSAERTESATLILEPECFLEKYPERYSLFRSFTQDKLGLRLDESHLWVWRFFCMVFVSLVFFCMSSACVREKSSSKMFEEEIFILLFFCPLILRHSELHIKFCCDSSFIAPVGFVF